MPIRAIFLLAPLLFLFWSCAHPPEFLQEDVPLLEEVEVGKELFPWAVQKMGGVYSDPELNAYVVKVKQKLAKQAGRTEVSYQIRLVNSSLPGGFAFPGGYIGITRGLLLNLENETQLAAIIGHLMAHVEDYHLNDALRDSNLYLRLQDKLPEAKESLSYDQSVVTARQLADQLLAWEFDLREERDADRIAVNYLNQTGYETRGILWLMDVWPDFEGLKGRMVTVSPKLQPHPVSEERWIITKRYVDNFLYSGNRSRFVGEETYAAATEKLHQKSQGYDYFDQGMELEKRGDLNGAVALYLKAAAQAGDEPLILCHLGLAYLKAEDPNSAGRYLRQAIRLDPDYYYSRLGMGYSLLESGQAEQAQKHLEASMRLLPTIEGAFLLAEVYEKQGKLDQALRLYDHVARAEPVGKFGRQALEKKRLLENP